MTERPALRVIDGSAHEDPVARRRRFEQEHPEAVILPPCAGRWHAVVPAGLIAGDGTRTTLGSWDLEGLMNQLDEIYPPNGMEPTAGWLQVVGERPATGIPLVDKSVQELGDPLLTGPGARVTGPRHCLGHEGPGPSCARPRRLSPRRA